MSVNLNENEFAFIQEYCQMVTIVKEAFDFIEDSFENAEVTNRMQVLTDIFSAFIKLHETNRTLQKMFNDNEDILKTVNEFEEFIIVAQRMEHVLEDEQQLEAIIKEKVVPHYNDWAKRILLILKPHIEQ